jgi:hypothetical protein
MQLPDFAANVIKGKRSKTEQSIDVDALYKKIGKLEIERDFLVTRPGVIGHLSRVSRVKKI